MKFKENKSGLFDLKNRLKIQQERLAKWVGRPTGGMRTPCSVQGLRVIFIHNPQTGGTSLGQALGVRRLSHAFPDDRLSEKSWVEHYVICAVRNPFDRFVSSYLATIDPRHPTNGLTKIYGQKIKNLSAFDFLDLLKQAPKFGGVQKNWACFKSDEKPNADLILRFEEIGTWPKLLEDAGLTGPTFTLEHKNKKPYKTRSQAELLGMNKDEIHHLKVAIYNHFQVDYEHFSYEKPF